MDTTKMIEVLDQGTSNGHSQWLGILLQEILRAKPGKKIPFIPEHQPTTEPMTVANFSHFSDDLELTFEVMPVEIPHPNGEGTLWTHYLLFPGGQITEAQAGD